MGHVEPAPPPPPPPLHALTHEGTDECYREQELSAGQRKAGSHQHKSPHGQADDQEPPRLVGCIEQVEQPATCVQSREQCVVRTQGVCVCAEGG